MEKHIRQIRDIELIEKELHNTHVGILALHEDEKVLQIPTIFLYLDKNIYIFLEDEEIYQALHFDSHASFALIRNEKPRKSSKQENRNSYQALSITISGSLRKVDEQKLDEIKSGFVKKYSVNGDESEKAALNGKAVIIDSEEIQAFEETGG